MALASLHTGLDEIVSLIRAVVPLTGAGREAARIADQVLSLLVALDDLAWAAAEDELLAAGVNRSVVSSLASRRQQQPGLVARAAGEQRRHLDVPPGHPIDTLLCENEAIRSLADELSHLAESPVAAATSPADLVERLRRLADSLSETRKHRSRVQNVLLPQLERRGLQGLTRTLWAYTTGVRSRLAALHTLLARAPADPAELRAALQPIVPALLKSLHASMEREEQVLAPLLLRLLTEQEWAEVWHDSQSCGWCLVEPGREYSPNEASDGSEETASESSDRVRFAAGELTASQLRGIFAVLPVDVTFVDENDAVRFFTEGPDRIFPRTRSVLGRKVQNCHPPSSLRQVNRILNEFRDGRRDVAEFWFSRRGQFVHVRYFAVRDRTGAYLGALEVAQDLAPLRALQGEQRLLMDNGGAEPAPAVRGP